MDENRCINIDCGALMCQYSDPKDPCEGLAKHCVQGHVWLEKPRVVVIDCGCAECGSGDYPLIEINTFDSVEEAKLSYERYTWARNITWQPHPQGGEKWTHGQGEVWILPVGVSLAGLVRDMPDVSSSDSSGAGVETDG